MPEPRNIADFDPFDHPDREHALTLAIRGLRMGDALRLPGGTVVRCTPMARGGSQERRFAVIPSESKSTPEERHKAHILGHSTYRNAKQAADQALKKD